MSKPKVTTHDARKYQTHSLIREVTDTYGMSLVDIKNDCVALLRLGYTLRPNVVDIAVDDKGSGCKTVMNVNGTIPCFIGGQEYNIPITIWLTGNYPESPPPTYVSPLPGTMLDPELRCVSHDGLVRIKYVLNWNSSSNLVQLVRELASEFSQTPPVYSASPRVVRQRVPKPAAQIPSKDMLFGITTPKAGPRRKSQLVVPPPAAVESGAAVLTPTARFRLALPARGSPVGSK